MTVSVATLKAHLNIVDDNDSDLITQKLEAAQTYVEAETGLDLDTNSNSLLDEAVLKLAAHWYDNRGLTGWDNVADGVPDSIRDLITPAKEWAF